jgi:hypothetical protein
MGRTLGIINRILIMKLYIELYMINPSQVSLSVFRQIMLSSGGTMDSKLQIHF